MNLPALLDILKDPENPAFGQALEKISTLNPAELPLAEIPFLLAQINTTLQRLDTQKNATAEQLQNLRRQTLALKSYGAVK